MKCNGIGRAVPIDIQSKLFHLNFSVWGGGLLKGGYRWGSRVSRHPPPPALFLSIFKNFGENFFKKGVKLADLSGKLSTIFLGPLFKFSDPPLQYLLQYKVSYNIKQKTLDIKLYYYKMIVFSQLQIFVYRATRSCGLNTQPHPPT